jgi:hypothetical protein
MWNDGGLMDQVTWAGMTGRRRDGMAGVDGKELLIIERNERSI